MRLLLNSTHCDNFAVGCYLLDMTILETLSLSRNLMQIAFKSWSQWKRSVPGESVRLL